MFRKKMDLSKKIGFEHFSLFDISGKSLNGFSETLVKMVWDHFFAPKPFFHFRNCPKPAPNTHFLENRKWGPESSRQGLAKKFSGLQLNLEGRAHFDLGGGLLPKGFPRSGKAGAGRGREEEGWVQGGQGWGGR